MARGSHPRTPARPRSAAPGEWRRFEGYMVEIFTALGMDLDTPGTRKDAGTAPECPVRPDRHAANRTAMSSERMRDAVPPAQTDAVIEFLCSEGADAVTGAGLPVYGWA